MSEHDEERKAHVCIDCRARSPETDTNYTLISSRYGWRLTRRREAGEFIVEWRCPRCWDKYKRAKIALSSSDEHPAMKHPSYAPPPSSRDAPSGDRPIAAMPPARKRK